MSSPSVPVDPSGERKEQIRERLARATPGPWTYEAEMRPLTETAHFQIKSVEPQPKHPWSPRFIAWLCGGRSVAPRVFEAMSRYDKDKLIDAGLRPDDLEAQPDAELIANAPSDLAFLLAENDALRARLEGAIAFIDNFLTRRRPNG